MTASKRAVALWAIWPAGVLLAVGRTELHLPTPVFLLLDLAYVLAAAVVLRRAGTAAALLAAPAVVIFGVASWTGAPTAAAPGMMALNTAVLLVAAAVLLIAYHGIATRLPGGSARHTAGLAMLALGIGTGGYLANLLARFAVLLSGAAPAQVRVEETAWQAYAYLQGLDGEPEPLTLLLVWLDLLQVAYVALAYLATAALAVACARAGVIGARAGRWIAAAGTGFATAIVAGSALGTVPTVGPAAAGLVFALTIPFMSTLLPTVLAGALTGVRPAGQTAVPATARVAGPDPGLAVSAG